MLSSVFEWWENMQFHYLSIVGDESMPKASKLYMWFRFARACVCWCVRVHGRSCVSRPMCGSICEFFKSLCIHVLVRVLVRGWGKEGRREGGTIFYPLCLSTVICISAAHHYLKVSINQSPLLFIVSPCTVQRLLNKKTFLYGEEGGRERKKCNCIHWTLKCFDGFWEPHYIYIGMCH